MKNRPYSRNGVTLWTGRRGKLPTGHPTVGKSSHASGKLNSSTKSVYISNPKTGILKKISTAEARGYKRPKQLKVWELGRVMNILGRKLHKKDVFAILCK